MHLKNNFKERDKAQVWIDHPYCAVTGSNVNCSLHHIYGRKGTYNNSIFNAIMLSYDQHKKADGNNVHVTGNQIRREYLMYAMNMVMKAVSNGVYTIKPRDINFLETVKEDVEWVKENI